jgi:hypothetical protein
MLKEDGRFPFQQKIESILGPIHFEKPINGQDDENNSRKDRQIDE